MREVELNQERNRGFVEIHSCNDQSCSPSPVQFDLEVKVHPVLLSKLQAIFDFFRSPSDSNLSFKGEFHKDKMNTTTYRRALNFKKDMTLQP